MRLPQLALDVDVCRPLPRVGQFGRSLIDLDSGDLISDTVTSRKVQGSYHTSIQIRCDGSTVQVTGNPSKFGRLDNLFGYRRIDDCVAVFNAVLTRFDLPPFTKATYYRPSQQDSARARMITDGALFTQFDLTQNHACGSSSLVLPALRALSTNTGGRKIPHLFANGRTVEWIYENSCSKGSTYLYSKGYDKAFEMELHPVPYDLTEEDRNYLERLKHFVKSQGCIREEHSLKSKFLKRAGTYVYGIVDEKRLDAQFEKVRDMWNKATASVADYQNVGTQLVAMNACSEAMAAKMQNLVYAWISGVDVRSQTPSKATFYRYRDLLLPLGLDIKLKFDVTRMNTKIRTIELRPLAVPDFYRHADLSDQIRQVA